MPCSEYYLKQCTILIWDTLYMLRRKMPLFGIRCTKYHNKQQGTFITEENLWHSFKCQNNLKQHLIPHIHNCNECKNSRRKIAIKSNFLISDKLIIKSAWKCISIRFIWYSWDNFWAQVLRIKHITFCYCMTRFYIVQHSKMHPSQFSLSSLELHIVTQTQEW